MADINTGLSSREVLESREIHGSNILTPPKRDPWYILFAEKFKDPLIQILCVAAVISIILGYFKGEFIDSIGIVFAILLATTLAFLNEFQASKKFDILNKINDDVLIKVRRDGLIQEVPVQELVVGDIVMLGTGDEIPADVRILHASNLKVNESSFTGESKAVTKSSEIVGNPTYPSNMGLKGSLIEEGTGIGFVMGIGDNTVIGQTARKASEITDTETPLNKQLNGLADMINKIAFGAAGLLIISLVVKYVFITHGYVGKDWMAITNDVLQFLMIAVALIVVAVPEGLPMAVTLALAYSMKRMANINNLIRKMHACETLGATTLILTDKTGTLTKNMMTVVGEDILDSNYLVSGVICNSTASLDKNRQVVGNPTEGALLKNLPLSAKDIEDCRKGTESVFSVPFDSKSKFMITVVRQGEGFLSLLKGAPEIVRTMCVDDTFDESSITIQQGKGRRVIGFAYKESTTIEDAQKLNEFKFNGIYCIEDPIREDVPQAMKDALKAGINVKVVTGDNAATAGEIARQAGLGGEEGVVTSTAQEYKESKFPYTIGGVNVFARTKPEDKLDLVKQFQERGEIVAMTGDGTNDAPALNYAHVGIAMNNGTSVAKEAADVILLDNSFPSIVTGIKWGRSLYKNIQHFILFQLTVNVVAVLIACVGPFIGVDLPFTVIQMLWVNLIMDTFAALALATEPASDDVMNDSPRDPKAFIITSNMWTQIMSKGLGMFILLLYFLITKTFNTTEFFTFFVLLQWWNLFSARVYGQKKSMFSGIFNNKAFIGISAAILIGQVLIVQFGGKMFRTEALDLKTWGMLFICSAAFFVIDEVKLLFKRVK